MVIWIPIALAVAIIVFFVIVAMKPADFIITRSTTISAPSAVVFAQVNDFHNWEAWSPWAKLDPGCKKSYDGAAAGPGAIYSWSGDKKVGEGRMTLTDSRPNEMIRIKLEFKRPFVATNVAEFTFKPTGDQTNVVWSMSGKSNFVMRAVCMFMNMDKMVGGEFEKGLASMKTVAEAAAGK